MVTISMNSPVGTLYLSEEDGFVVRIDTKPPSEALSTSVERGRTDAPNYALEAAVIQLQEYFQKKRETFDFPMKAEGTAFQTRVWEALKTIPYGETISYEELAERAGTPKGMRAVGNANGKNPLMIVVPCHRVVRKSGALGGYTGGVGIKEALLHLENAKIASISTR